MLIPIKFAELHNPLFLNGTNLQLKLDPKHRPELVLVYDRTEKELIVFYKEALAIVPSTNVASMQPQDPLVFGAHPKPTAKVVPIVQPTAPKGPIKAQVSTPHDHVFKGK